MTSNTPPAPTDVDADNDDPTEPQEVTVPDDPIRWLADAYAQVQRTRIRVGNQIAAVERDADHGPVPSSIRQWFLDLASQERAIGKDMAIGLVGHPAMPWMGRVKGFGAITCGKVLGMIGDIGTFDTVSKLWRFAGYAVIEGTRERLTKGEKAHYSTRLKTTCYLATVSLIRTGDSPYRVIYDQARGRYETRDGWTKGHQHNAALRKVTKLWLSHLWQTWREAKGLPVRLPYPIEYQQHTTFYDPWDYVRPEGGV